MLLPFFAGFVSSMPVAPFAEWFVHKSLMHQPKSKRSFFSRRASASHQDDHHSHYLAPYHYYRDMTNEDSVIHFSPMYVGIIAAMSFGLGLGIKSIANLFGADASLSDDTSYGAGFTAGNMVYYGAYELAHHYMHVLGYNRQTIIESFAHTLYDGTQDVSDEQRMRFSKSFVDDSCSFVEDIVSKKKSLDAAVDALHSRYDTQLAVNKSHERVVYRDIPLEDLLLSAVTDLQDKNNKEQRSFFQGITHTLGSYVLKMARDSKIFRRLDDHHFLHHARMGHNLNVVCPLADYVIGTKLRPPLSDLEDPSNWRYWISMNYRST